MLADVDGGYLPAGQFAATDTAVLKTADADTCQLASSFCATGTDGESHATTRGAVAQISNGNGLNPTATAKDYEHSYRSDGPRFNSVLPRCYMTVSKAACRR